MQGDVGVPGVRGLRFRGRGGAGRGRGELEEQGGAPFRDGPGWGLEVGFAGEGADGVEVFGGEEEGVGELVFVDEEGGGEG